MKKSFYILVLVGCVLNLMFTVSCNKTPTYEELKSAEQKIVRKILSDENITVLSEYPESGVFKENEFVLLNSGIYINVVDSGNGKRAVPYFTDVLVRVSGKYYTADSAITFSTFYNALYPMEFKYGNAYGVVQEHSMYDDLYFRYFSMGIESALAYVGDSSVVKLLVPGYSEISGAAGGSTLQNGGGSAYIPIFYDRVRFIFY